MSGRVIVIIVEADTNCSDSDVGDAFVAAVGAALYPLVSDGTLLEASVVDVKVELP